MPIATYLLPLLIGPLAAPAPPVTGAVPGGDPQSSVARREPPARRGPAAQRGAIPPEVRVIGARPSAARAAASAPPPPAAPALGPDARRLPATPRHDLARARELFGAADRNSDSRLTPAEARLAGIGARQFRTFDQSGDGLVSEDDFVLGYRSLVASAGHHVERDLEFEAGAITIRQRLRGPKVERDDVDDSSQIERVRDLRRRHSAAEGARGSARRPRDG